ncbi:hypothetical protein [Actinobacillus capsulatus]|uniref:hypothetical protein n=1 Tax=Actinobacillus capsulatus TaxID=717 RepID=UPI00037D61FE|nr:hypothetical protein [Actinobacillus capsulatus]
MIGGDQATLVLINRWVAPPSYRDLRNTEHSHLYFLPDNPSFEDTRIHVKLHVEPNNSNVVDVGGVYNTNYSIHFDVQDIASSSTVKFGTDYTDNLMVLISL